MKVAGIDGYKGGWIAVTVDAGDFLNARVLYSDNLYSLIETKQIDFCVVDTPIGLTLGPNDRETEKCVRQFMPQKSSSVFNAPCRAVLNCATYEEAQIANRAAVAKGLSKQSWAIVPKIKEADHVVRQLGQDRVCEGHPEVSFTAQSGAPILASKKSLNGALTRLSIIQTLGFDLEKFADDLPDRHPAKLDDLLDAAILAWSADRVTKNCHIRLPSHPDRDDTGLEMVIVA